MPTRLAWIFSRSEKCTLKNVKMYFNAVINNCEKNLMFDNNRIESYNEKFNKWNDYPLNFD